MSAESKIYAALSTTTSITALVSTRIYPVAIPQAVAAFPTVVYTRIGGHRIFTLEGYTGLEDVDIQIDCCAVNYDGAKDLSKLVADAMTTAKEFIAHLNNNSDGLDPETGVFRVTQEYSVQHTE